MKATIRATESQLWGLPPVVKPTPPLPEGTLICHAPPVRENDPQWILPLFLLLASIVGASVKLLTH